jgi:hypothetical protein
VPFSHHRNSNVLCSVARPIVYGNDAHLIPPEERTSDHTHRWTVALRSAASLPPPDDPKELNSIGGVDDLSYFIKKVTFKLHETYPTPLRSEFAVRTLCRMLKLLQRLRQTAVRSHRDGLGRVRDPNQDLLCARSQREAFDLCPPPQAASLAIDRAHGAEQYDAW